MLEPKKKTALQDPDVVARKDAAEKWCKNASDYAIKHGGKPWIHKLIPHDVIAENMTIAGLSKPNT